MDERTKMQNILDPKWFTLEMDSKTNLWYPVWYHQNGKKYGPNLFSYDTIREARAEAENMLELMRGVKEPYYDWTVLQWEGRWWIEWVDENFDATQREGGFLAYKDAYFWAQGLAAERKNPLMKGKVLDFRAPAKPSMSPLTSRDREDLQAAIDKHFLDYCPVQPNATHVKTFDEKWAEGIKAFLVEPETVDGQA